MELISAAKNGNFELAFNLLRSGCSTNVCDKDNATPLYWSACHGHTNICEILIQSGSDVNTRVKWGSTALHAAADRGHKACIEVLLDSGVSVNARNSRGDTALHIAAYRGHIDIIMTLLRAKADVTLRNEKGKTPQQEALEGGHRQIAENIVNFINGTLLGPIPMTTSSDVTSVSLRQASEVSDEDQCHTYENSSCTKRLHGPLPLRRQNSMDSPPPRPPLNLTRSISLSDPQVRSQDGFMPLSRLPDNLIEPRTSSFTRVNEDDVSSDVMFNNVNRNYRAEESVEGSVFASQNDSMSQASFLTESSAYSSGVSWNNTSHSENDVITTGEHIATSRDFAQVPLRLNSSLTRPNRSSIGSIREISNNCPDITSSGNSQGFMLTLQSQLVESYRTIERLTTENESLKFKCSTLLNRLCDTERNYNEKFSECEDLKRLLERGTSARENDESCARENGDHCKNNCDGATGSTSWDSDLSTHGFKQFCEHLSKEISEENTLEMQEILRVSGHRADSVVGRR